LFSFWFYPSNSQIESLDEGADDYIVLDRHYLRQFCGDEPFEQEYDEDGEPLPLGTVDPLLPPIHHLLTSDGASEAQRDSLVADFKQSHMRIVAHLDRANPLTEARWVKNGDIDNWITQMTQHSKGDYNHPSDSLWRGKIHVSDPDPVSLYVAFSLVSSLHIFCLIVSLPLSNMLWIPG
jgi:hypothetical protein